jgi:hypothetical protein
MRPPCYVTAFRKAVTCVPPAMLQPSGRL